MKKFILVSFLALFAILFNEAVFAYGDHVTCDDADDFCQYQGMYNNLEGADEEFQMLLEPVMHPNFQVMFMYVNIIMAKAYDNSNTECLKAIRNSNCNVSKYIKKLFRFYEENKAKIKENLASDNDKDDEIANIFDEFKKLIGSKFFSEEAEVGTNAKWWWRW